MALSDAKMILPRHEFTSGVTTNYDPGEKGRKMTRAGYYFYAKMTRSFFAVKNHSSTNADNSTTPSFKKLTPPP